MSVLNADHLLAQAAKLITTPPAGPPRQVDVRRAISSAYYALFHHVLAAAADEFVGAKYRGTPRYALVYRSISHTGLSALCADLRKPSLPARYKTYEPAGGFDPDLKAFTNAEIELQQRRHAADYDPLPRFKTADARLVIATARSAMQRLDQSASRPMFLTLLVCPPRPTA